MEVSIMDVKSIGNIITNFKSKVIIIDRTGNVLWKSRDMGKLIDIKNIKDIDIDIEDIILNKNLKVMLYNDSYNLSSILLGNQEKIILIFDLIGDYNDDNTKSYILEEIIERLYDGVLVSDKDGRVVIYNPAMEELEEMESKDMIGEYIWDAYGYGDKNKSEHMGVQSSRIPIINRYKAHAYNNGKPIYKSYSTYPIEKDGEIIGVYSISKNETKLQSLLSEIVDLKRQFGSKIKDDSDIKFNGTRFTFSDIIGSSTRIKKLIHEAQSISWLNNNILIVGETGTGKEVFAQSIHNYGKRNREPFIGINCSAIPENLLESILFGTVKGAFTGAIDSSGLFEEAGEGTLFLDELNSMPINMQTKLLRVLQEKCVRRVGGKEMYPIRCRVISAMNEDPYLLIEEGKLRQDLYYRIAGYNLVIPPLRERDNDIFDLSKFYISRNNLNMNKNVSKMKEDLKDFMKEYSWPGNIRELEHFIENIMVRTEVGDTYLRRENIPGYLLEVMNSIFKENKLDNISEYSLEEKINEFEKSLILNSLDNNNWNVTRTAKELGVTRQSLIYRMKKLDLNRS
jgi:arginine utilization regulatory protein